MGIVPEDSAVRAAGVRVAMAGVTAAVLVADQVSKALVLAAHPAAGDGWAAIRLARNTGASGGIAAGYPVLVTLAAAVIAGLAAALAVRARGRAVAVCLAAVFGGALGNLSDRVFRSPGFGRGAVVDWIHLGGSSGSSGSFNVADTAIQVGVLGAVAAMFLSERARKAGQPREHANPG